MKTTPITISLIISLAAIATAATVRVNFKQNAADNDQAGWTNTTDEDGSGSSAEFGGFTHAVAAVAVRGHSGNGYSLVDHIDGDLDNLLSSGFLSNNQNKNISLTLSGLADGDYEITTYHHAMYTITDISVIFDLSVNTGGGDVLIQDNVGGSFGDSVETTGISNFVTAFTVSGGAGGDVTLTFDPSNASGPDHLTFNGFELTSVPEPTTTGLLGLGGLALILRRSK